MSMIPTREQVPQISRVSSAIGPPRAAAPSGAGGMTAQDVVRIIRKRKWLIVLSVLICLAVAATVTQLWLMYSPLYTARAYLGVNPPGETDLRPGVLTGEIMDRHKMSVARMAQTEPVFQKTIEKSEVKTTSWWRENLADPIPSLVKATSVTPIRETNFIELSMTGPNKKELAEIVNAWAYAVVEDRTGIANTDRRATIKRLETQQERLGTEMDRFDRDLKMLESSDERVIQHKISLLTNELQTLTGQLTNLRLFHDSETRNRKNFEDQEKAGLLDTLPEIIDIFERDPLLRQQHAEIAGLSTALDSFRQKVGERHKGYKDLIQRIESVKQRITEREQSLRVSQISLLKDSYERRIQMLAAQIQALADNAGKIESQVTALQGNLRNVIEWQAEKARRQARIELLERPLMELRLSTRGAQPVYVRQPATEPKRPSMPRWGLMIPLGALLGLAIGFGLTFVLELIDTSIKSPSDISRRVDLPLLGMVPHTADLDEDIEDLRLAFMTNPNSVVGEAFRQIRTCLQFSAPASQLRSILITSALPGDGRGTVTTNLAAATAHSGNRVLVVDANFRQPMSRKIFPQCPEGGLSNALVGQAHWKDMVREVHPNLFVLGSGPLPPNPAELLGSDAMRSVLAEMVDEYDQVFFDGAPCLLVTDAAVLSTLVDGVVLVVRAATNTHGVVQRARDVLGRVGARILGVVLNGIRTTAGGYLRKNYRTFYEYHSQEAPVTHA